MSGPDVNQIPGVAVSGHKSVVVTRMTEKFTSKPTKLVNKVFKWVEENKMSIIEEERLKAKTCLY